TRDLNDVLKLFLEVGQEICEGQDMDMHFEESSSGNMDAYEEMVRQKTAVLLGFSLYAGARASDIPEELSKALYDYGVQSGIVFQMWDDYLDVFSAETTGKRNAGDLYNRKETCLVIKLKEVMVAEDFGQFEMIWKNSMSDRDVEKIKSLFGKYDIKKTIEQIVQDKLNQAKRKISSTFSDEQISPILNFTDQFILRNK
ncbi:MAG TPA: polyprenyl synthetase family protein, partial [Bacteroidales bacterium]|nr:polyprenyl synthetase family protein [Bacteroidales bacterium]